MEIEELSLTATRTHLRLKGVLDALAVDKWETRFTALTAARKQDTLVELAEVSYCSSLGIRMLLAAAKAVVREGKRFVLIAPRHEVAGILQLAGLDRIMPIVATLSEAEALLAE